MRAWCLIRDQPVYRREAFLRGLAHAGCEVIGGLTGQVEQPDPGDALVIWNRYGANHDLATRFEAKGGTVIVAENAYVGNDRRARTRYAIAQGAHNGLGIWPLGGPERWRALGIELKPWRQTGDHILVCPNRSFGMPGYIMPPMWAEQTVDRLRRTTRRPVVLRPHPGNDPPRRALADDLRGAWAAVIWTSSAGCEALIGGIPVFCVAPWWICSGATLADLQQIEAPLCGDAERRQAMERLAWAQWSVEEIESGAPFQHLLHGTPALADRV